MAERIEKSSTGLPQAAQSEETYKTSDPRAHILQLDGMRGIGILCVVIAHVAGRWWQETEYYLYVPLIKIELLAYLGYAYLAIPLFFLLSGYLLTSTEENRRQRGTYSILNYAKRRALRIMPAYYTAIAVAVVLEWLAWPRIDASFEAVTLHLTFLHGFHPQHANSMNGAWWSQTPEIVFYATLPLLVLTFRRFWQRLTIFVMLLLISLATRVLMVYNTFGLLTTFENFGGNQLYYFPTTLLYLFLAGMLIRMMVERYTDVDHKLSQRQLSAISALTIVSVAVLVLVFPYLVQQGKMPLLWPILAEAVLVLVFACTLMGSPVLKPILEWRPLVFFGQMSYSWFLLHNFVVIAIALYARPWLRNWLPHQGELTMWAAFFALVFASLAVSGVIGYLSFRYIESPFMRIKPK